MIIKDNKLIEIESAFNESKEKGKQLLLNNLLELISNENSKKTTDFLENLLSIKKLIKKIKRLLNRFEKSNIKNIIKTKQLSKLPLKQQEKYFQNIRIYTNNLIDLNKKINLILSLGQYYGCWKFTKKSKEEVKKHFNNENQELQSLNKSQYQPVNQYANNRYLRWMKVFDETRITLEKALIEKNI
ncbi:hypothetical protein [Mesomycoplasma lagogenitalium]|uniref:Uncharacterized protein n=1 Tax=Mesomycoplasma lagogenitalium TaxID=171286 RepID=A0ABY8LW88_9BACT|nr:hypothetical protein [Mesomycoplasma lagogenitalium]WGI36506.1 hypothetical protein QEG99_03510 [Mesomycoplasma lagogenitalium]